MIIMRLIHMECTQNGLVADMCFLLISFIGAIRVISVLAIVSTIARLSSYLGGKSSDDGGRLFCLLQTAN